MQRRIRFTRKVIDALGDLRAELKGDTAGVCRVNAGIDANLDRPLDTGSGGSRHHVAEQPTLHAASGDD